MSLGVRFIKKLTRQNSRYFQCPVWKTKSW